MRTGWVQGAGFALVGAVLLAACSTRDGSTPDAGAADAGRVGLDASTRDAARPDAGDGGEAPTDASGDAPGSDPPIDAAATPTDAGNGDPGNETTRCDIGGAMQNDGGGWTFVPFVVGDLIPLIGGGQGALSAEIGLRVLAPPLPIDVRIVVRAVESGRSRLVVRAMEDDFACDGDGWCTLAPVYVPTWTLVDDPFDLMNLQVAVTATFGALDDPHCLATHVAELYRF